VDNVFRIGSYTNLTCWHALITALRRRASIPEIYLTVKFRRLDSIVPVQ
jgi:hypothetical protein